jgi:copper chaperone CopZ
VITKLAIAGMTCNNCVRHVAQALRDLPGVSSVEVDLVSGHATVTHDATTSFDSLIKAVESEGYEAGHVLAGSGL